MHLELTILMPCLNESRTVGICVGKAMGFLRESGIAGEVVVADNGSSDGSQQVATEAGARVVAVSERGYGSALRGGIRAARGKFVIMGDADDSYDFSSLRPFVDALREGAQLVMGNRFAGGIMPGAMPPLHRYLGNPVLSFIGRLFFKAPVRDFHCGLRGFDRDAVLALRLATTGMEFASEMVVKAALAGYRIREVPIILHRDGRGRPPHLNSWRDGWRHLRFLLLYSPRWLFLYPGLTLFITGALLQGALFFRPIAIGPLVFDINSMLYASAAMMLGLQMCVLAVLTKAFAIDAGLLPRDARFERTITRISLEIGIVAGLLIALAGVGLALYTVVLWQETGFHALDPRVVMRRAISAAALITAGGEVVIASFFLSVLRLKSPLHGA